MHLFMSLCKFEKQHFVLGLFDSDFGERIDFQCERNYYLAGLYSDYSASHWDRKWRGECCNSPRKVYVA